MVLAFWDDNTPWKGVNTISMAPCSDNEKIERVHIAQDPSHLPAEELPYYVYPIHTKRRLRSLYRTLGGGPLNVCGDEQGSLFRRFFPENTPIVESNSHAYFFHFLLTANFAYFPVDLTGIHVIV